MSPPLPLSAAAEYRLAVIPLVRMSSLQLRMPPQISAHRIRRIIDSELRTAHTGGGLETSRARVVHGQDIHTCSKKWGRPLFHFLVASRVPNRDGKFAGIQKGDAARFVSFEPASAFLPPRRNELRPCVPFLNTR